MKKVLALALSAMMVLALVGTALAADPAYDATVSITGLKAGDKVTFYQIVEFVDDRADNVGGWAATSDFASNLTSAKLAAILGASGTNFTPAIAAELAATAGSLTGATVTVPASGTTATYTVPAAGVYMAIVDPVDVDEVYNPIFVSADFNKTNGTSSIAGSATYSDTSATVKKSTTTLTKTAATTEATYQDGAAHTAAVGETVSFTVQTKIPAYAAYQAPVFKIKDTLTDLTLKTGTVKVTVPAGLTKGNQYTVTETATGYTLSFSETYLKTLSAITDVTVTYDALVATTAAHSIDEETNTVTTEYSTNPEDTTGGHLGYKKDVTKHYTFSLDADAVGLTSSQHGEKTSEIVKVGVGPDGQPIMTGTEYSEVYPTEYWEGPLADAEFKLYVDAACTTEYQPKNADGTNAAKLELKSGTDGRMKISGLDAGTYYLKETKAPDGFIKQTDAVKIEITTVTEDVTVTEYTTDGVTWISQSAYDQLTDKTGYTSYTYETTVLKSYTVKVNDAVAAEYTFTHTGVESEIDWTVHKPVEHPSEIVNTQGLELPSTGGIGTTIFYVSGLVMVLGAAAILVARRKADYEA